MTTPVTTPATSNEETLPPMDPEEFQRVADDVRSQVRSVIVGQNEAIEGTLTCLIAGGHALLEGVPGLGKTSLVRAFGRALDLRHGRIQFTPDLMPADITGTTVLAEDPGGRRTLTFQPGPVFGNLILADEINRATPKTQSALLEAMQEGTVTLGHVQRRLPQPFCVLATQNPIELQGTYPLPEAQLDRFFLKLFFSMPSLEDLDDIVLRTSDMNDLPVRQVADAATLLRMHRLASQVPMARHVVDYASRIVLALQPAPDANDLVKRHVRLGPSPRGAQALCLAGRVGALLAGRYNLAFADVRSIAKPALRHRMVLTFDAQRQGISPDTIIDQVVTAVPEESR
ncbi:MAG: AAA family ATPase [Chloroflexota bacterium]